MKSLSKPANSAAIIPGGPSAEHTSIPEAQRLMYMYQSVTGVSAIILQLFAAGILALVRPKDQNQVSTKLPMTKSESLSVGLEEHHS